MTVIEIILTILIVWILSMIFIIFRDGIPEFISDWIETIISSLSLTLLLICGSVIIYLIGYGLWHAPWYNWFHYRLW
jgi:hypothetical protein